MRKRKKTVQAIGCLIGVIILISIKSRAEAAALTGNPNISWSPDGQAFTTDAGETGRTSYGMGYTVTTGTVSTKEELQTGQHYYESNRAGEIPIEKWVVSYEPGRCIHNGYPEFEYWHGVDYGRQICKETYKSGWLGTCADCGQAIHMLFYMDKETAESLKYLPADYDYYYLCPHCNNLEQGATIQHRVERCTIFGGSFNIAEAYNRPVKDWEDFEPEEEKLLSELILKETGSEFVFVTHYPSIKRPFYAMDNKENCNETESFDLLFRGLEITTGGQRIHNYEEQISKMKRKNMNVVLYHKS